MTTHGMSEDDIAYARKLEFEQDAMLWELGRDMSALARLSGHDIDDAVFRAIKDDINRQKTEIASHEAATLSEGATTMVTMKRKRMVTAESVMKTLLAIAVGQGAVFLLCVLICVGIVALGPMYTENWEPYLMHALKAGGAAFAGSMIFFIVVVLMIEAIDD